MTNEQLLSFIKKQLSLGDTKEKISSELLLNGWEKEDIEEGFSVVNNTNSNVSILKNQTTISKEKKHFGLALIFLILAVFIIVGAGFYFRDELKNLSIMKKIFPSLYQSTISTLPSENKIIKQAEDLRIDLPNIVDYKKEAKEDTTDFLKENTEKEIDKNKLTDDMKQDVKNTSNEILFKAKVSNVLMNSLLLDQGKKLTDFVEVKLPGQLYNPEKEFGVIGRELARYDTPINAVIADFSAFKSGDSDWIISNFISEEQNYPRSLLSDKNTYEKIKKHYELLNKVKIKGEIKYKDYNVVFIQYVGDNFSDPIQVMIFKNVSGKWGKTNALTDDLNMSIVVSALWNGEFAQIK